MFHDHAKSRWPPTCYHAEGHRLSLGELGNNSQRRSRNRVRDFFGGRYRAFSALTRELCEGDAYVDALAFFFGESAPDAIWLAGSD